MRRVRESQSHSRSRNKLLRFPRISIKIVFRTQSYKIIEITRIHFFNCDTYERPLSTLCLLYTQHYYITKRTVIYIQRTLFTQKQNIKNDQKEIKIQVKRVRYRDWTMYACSDGDNFKKKKQIEWPKQKPALHV